MAMSGFGGDGGENGEGGGAGIFADINITPLTDIFLVLLIIFMVTTTAIAEAGGQAGIKVTLPKGGKADAVKEIHDLAIAVLQDGRVVVGGKDVSEQELEDMLAKAHSLNPDTLVLIQADEGVIHGKVVAVMDMARRHGLARLAIATRAEE